jgi:hypothetical protein
MWGPGIRLIISGRTQDLGSYFVRILLVLCRSSREKIKIYCGVNKRIRKNLEKKNREP